MCNLLQKYAMLFLKNNIWVAENNTCIYCSALIVPRTVLPNLNTNMCFQITTAAPASAVPLMLFILIKKQNGTTFLV